MNAKADVMQSNLPLLFTNGSPTSLESMSLHQLQSFLLFLLKCERGLDIQTLVGQDQPKWWPTDVVFHDEILGNNLKKGMWSSMLRKVIQKCYMYHNSDFLLDFSRRLMHCAQQNAGKIVIVDNGDGTRSMKSVATEKLLVTFRSENQDYDKRMRERENSFSTHSPMKGGCSLSSESNSSDPRLPLCSDLYLCDICGDDFESLQEVLAHEKCCEKNRQILPDVPSQQSESNKTHYFSYLRLQKAESQNEEASSRLAAAASQPFSNVVRPKPGSYAKFLSIDVASPLGRYITDLTKSSSDSIDVQALCLLERATTRSTKDLRAARRTRFPITYRGPRDRLAQKQAPHQYCFTRSEYLEKLRTLKTGLSGPTLQIFKQLSTKKLKVDVEREHFKDYPNVSPEEISQLLEKNRKIAAERLATSKLTAATVSQRQTEREETDSLPRVLIPKLLLPSPLQSRAVTSTSNYLAPKKDKDRQLSNNSFYQNFMYANHHVIRTSPSTKNGHISNGNNTSTNGSKVTPISTDKTVECIELSSTDDEEEEIEIDDPEEDDEDDLQILSDNENNDDLTVLSEFEDDENLAAAIRRVPAAVSAALRVKMESSDPLSII